MSLLSDTRRRTALSLLRRAGSSTLDELARRVTEREGGDEMADDRVERVAIELYHVHVPKLVEAGVVEAGDGADVLTYRGNELLDERGLL